MFVSGDLRTREFIGNDGQQRFSLDVTMDDTQLEIVLADKRQLILVAVARHCLFAARTSRALSSLAGRE